MISCGTLCKWQKREWSGGGGGPELVKVRVGFEIAINHQGRGGGWFAQVQRRLLWHLRGKGVVMGQRAWREQEAVRRGRVQRRGTTWMVQMSRVGCKL